MLDSGASSHMVGDANLVHNHQKISPIAIGLPNGDCIVACYVGSVTLGDGIKLDNVLYVPNLNCNLVSVLKLCKQLNCDVTYFDNFCVLQDRTLRTLIRAGEQREGIYYYKQASSNQANAVNAKCLWHRIKKRLVKFVLLYLPPSLRINCELNKEEACQICFPARQTRNKFPISEHDAKDVFDCDIWGPYRYPSLCGAHYFLSLVDDASRATWVYLIKDRREANKLVKGFNNMVKNQFHKGIKVVR